MSRRRLRLRSARRAVSGGDCRVSDELSVLKSRDDDDDDVTVSRDDEDDDVLQPRRAARRRL